MEGCHFANDSDYDQMQAIFNMFSTEVTEMLEEHFSFDYFVISCYGHVLIDLISAPKIEPTENNLTIATPCRSTFEPDQTIWAVSYPLEPVNEGEGNHISEEDARSGENDNGVKVSVTQRERKKVHKIL